MTELRELVRMHTRSFNARDLDNLASHAHHDAACFCDGEWVGEGPDAVRDALERELRLDADLVGRIARLGDEPVLCQLGLRQGRYEPRGAVRFKDDGDGRIRELRIEHGPRVVAGMVPEPDA